MTSGTRAGAVVVLGAIFGNRYPALGPAATRRGLVVLGVDTPTPGNQRVDGARRADPEHPLASIAELAWIDGCDHGAVLDQVLAWTRTYTVEAVVAFGEAYVEAAAVVADCLGLRGPGLRASRVCRDKLLQRRFLAPWSPHSQLVPAGARDEAAQVWDTFPAIVKPIGREASSGVCRVGDRTDLRAALREYPPGESVLIEQLVEGPEMSVESLVRAGEVVFASPTGKGTNETDSVHFVEMAHTAPDPRLDPASRDAVLAANAAILRRLAFADGVAHAEFRVDRDGAVVLMEIAARPAGDSIWALYHLVTGVPLETTLLALLLGEDVTHPQPRRFARQVYLPHQPGVLRGVSADGLDVDVHHLTAGWRWPVFRPVAPETPGTIHTVTAGRAPGTELSEIRESADRSTMFIIDAPTPAELDALEQRCRAAIRVHVDGVAQPAVTGAR